jgi:hypothetical protein
VGVDYRAKTIVGVPFEWDHFFEDYTEDRVVCSHPEAEGVRFCPVCGTRADQKVKQVPRKRVRKPFIGVGPFAHFSDPLNIRDDEYEAFFEDLWGMKIGKVKVINLGSYEHADLILGIEIGSTDSSRGHGDDGYAPSMEWERAKDLGDFACEQLEELGFDPKKVRQWTFLYCSY